MSQVYIKLREGLPVKTVPSFNSGIMEDYDDEGRLIGIEILNATGVTIDGEDAVKAIADLEWLHHDQRTSR